MRLKLFIILALLVAFFLNCSKDSDVTGPTDENQNGNGETQVTAFKMVKHAIFTELPDAVIFMFQVLDLSNDGVDFLTVDRFQIFEEGTYLSPESASAYLLKPEDMNYRARVKLIIDNNTGTELDALKKGAIEFVSNADPLQEIAVYTMSNELTKVQDFTTDVSALTAAINGISEGAAEANIYGSIMQVNREDKEEYSLSFVQQNMVIIFTDSPDNVDAYPVEVVAVANRNRKIYTVGYGGVDASGLEQIGTNAYFAAADEAALVKVAADVQTALSKYIHSFYWLGYRSKLRGGSGHELSLKIIGNTNSGEGSEILGTFSSNLFTDVNNGLYVNWSSAMPEGVDVVMIMVGKERTIRVLSIGGANVPEYSFSSADNSVATVQGGVGGRATIKATGADGDSTQVTITDTANNLTKVITVKIVRYQIGVVLFEVWKNVNGTSVTNLINDPRFPNNPSEVSELTSWEIPKDVDDNYGTRIRGFIHPAQTGKYTFWISSDDASSLKLSTDENPNNAVEICKVSSWTNSREWTKEAGQKSAPIQLEAGKAYYMESLHNEGSGGDNLAVAWAFEDATKEILAGDFISKWIGD